MPSSESCAVLVDKLLQRHRRPAAELLDEVVRALENPVLVVDRDLPQVLEKELVALGGGLPDALQGRLQLLKIDLLVLDALPQHLAQDLRGLPVRVFDRAEERVDLAAVRRGVFEDAG